MSVKVRDRKLADGRILLSYDVYYKGQRELRREEYPLYILPSDSESVADAKWEEAKDRAAELWLQVKKGNYIFRKPLPAEETLDPGSIDHFTYPTFLSLFKAEAERRSTALAERQSKLIKQGRLVHKKAHDDVYYCYLRFKDFLATIGKTDLHYQDFTLKMLGKFRSYLLDRVADGGVKFCQNTAAAYLKKLKTVAFIASDAGLIRREVVNKIPQIDLEDFERQWLTTDEVKVLLQDLKENPTDTLFKRAFLFACAVSLRFGDLATVTWGHVQDGRLVFKPGKNQGKKTLYLKLNETALGLMGEPKADDQVIFPVKYSSALNDKLNLWILGAGIKKKGRITWHSGRHTCATMLMKKNKNVVAVQKILGHSRTETTLIYAKVVIPELDDALDALDDDLME
jgi:integrase